jgi:hypothetical protein
MTAILLALPLLLVSATDEPLPVGSAPVPVVFEHFPDRLHAVIWRNWRLVPTARLAEVLGATAEQLEAVAGSMGLPPAGEVDPSLSRRLYITVLRRNWHLLPYEQILPLVGMTAEELAFALREDDFLFIKLGNLKPKCEPVRYAEPSAEARAQAAWIRGVVDRDFGDAIRAPEQPRLAFVDALSRVPEGWRAPERRPDEPPRFLYSYFGVFGDPLADGAPDPYPDGLLARLSASGANGVWLHVVLRQLAPGGAAFPEFGQGHEARLANLRRLVERAHRYGLDVYLYMNEPRAMPASFFASRAELAGAVEGDHQALCTSQPAVRAWLGDALAHVFREVPGLGGVFTITASENFTHCASHHHPESCPRCKDRPQADVIAEVNATIAEGVHRSAPKAKVIAWDWGWRDADAPAVIEKLPADVWLQSVSEWSLPIERGGVKNTVGEYSLSAVGPGPRATKHWALARAHGLKTSAKVQLNVTWELSAVPWLPVLDLVAEHVSHLRRADVAGLMLSWSLGGYPSPNLQVAQRLGQDPALSADGALDAVAAERYGADNVAAARRAWRAFSEAFRQYPYDGSVVYRAPQQYGPSNLLFARPTGYKSTMVGFPYDDLDGWRGPYPREVFARQFGLMADGWEAGVEALRAIPGAVAASDLRLAEAAGCHLRSVADQSQFVLARDAGDRPAMAKALAREAKTARRLFDLSRVDARVGFEASNHAYYVPLDLVEKVVNVRSLERVAGSQP